MIDVSRRSRGQGSVEYAGVLLVIAIVVAAVILAFSSQAGLINGKVAEAVCRVLTAGKGSCESSADGSSHKPVEPCTLDTTGFAAEAKAGVMVNGSENIIVQKVRLSNGKYRVTVTTGGSVGVEVGPSAGWHVSADGLVVGDGASASIGASLEGSTSVVYEVDSSSAADDAIRWAIYEKTRDKATSAGPLDHIPGVGWVKDHVVDPATDTVAGWAGLDDPGEPDTTIVHGGANADASATVAAGVGGGSASISGGAVIGVAVHQDGSKTISYQLEGEAGVKGAGGQAGGKAVRTAEVEYSPDGTMETVKFNETNASDDGTSTVTSYSLPIESQADKDAANNMLNNPNFTTWDSYFNAAKDHGTVTKVDYQDDGHSMDAGFDVMKVGISLTGSTTDQKATKAQYWDGTKYVTWSDCKV